MSFQNKQPLPIEERIQYAESLGLKRLEVTPIENMNPALGQLYLDFQRIYADRTVENIREMAQHAEIPPDKISKYVEKLEHLLGLMTDNSSVHQAEFLGFRMARERITDDELSAIVYVNFVLAEQMIGMGNYTTGADTLASFGQGFFLGHPRESKTQIGARIDRILKQLFSGKRISAYKQRTWAEADQYLP